MFRSDAIAHIRPHCYLFRTQSAGLSALTTDFSALLIIHSSAAAPNRGRKLRGQIAARHDGLVRTLLCLIKSYSYCKCFTRYCDDTGHVTHASGAYQTLMTAPLP